MTSVDRRAEPWRGQASIAWSPCCAQARSAPSFAWTRHGSRAMVATGITCWSYADLSKPASSITTVRTIPVCPMIACSWE